MSVKFLTQPLQLLRQIHLLLLSGEMFNPAVGGFTEQLARMCIHLAYTSARSRQTFDPTKKGRMKYQSLRFSLFKAKNRVRRVGETQFFMSDYAGRRVEKREAAYRGKVESALKLREKKGGERYREG